MDPLPRFGADRERFVRLDDATLQGLRTEFARLNPEE